MSSAGLTVVFEKHRWLIINYFALFLLNHTAHMFFIVFFLGGFNSKHILFIVSPASQRTALPKEEIQVITAPHGP